MPSIVPRAWLTSIMYQDAQGLLKPKIAMGTGIHSIDVFMSTALREYICVYVHVNMQSVYIYMHVCMQHICVFMHGFERVCVYVQYAECIYLIYACLYAVYKCLYARL